MRVYQILEVQQLFSEVVHKLIIRQQSRREVADTLSNNRELWRRMARTELRKADIAVIGHCLCQLHAPKAQ